jgi:Fe-S oxidoreductase
MISSGEPSITSAKPPFEARSDLADPGEVHQALPAHPQEPVARHPVLQRSQTARECPQPAVVGDHPHRIALGLSKADLIRPEPLQVIYKSGNSFGENRRRRGRWTHELDFEVKDARMKAVDVLWFVGDYASFDPRSQRVTRSLARLFRASGVDFGILYDGERNSGNDVRRVGEEGLFESLAAHNIELLSSCDFDRIVTSDPHSLNTLVNEYPQLGGSWTVSHHTQLLLELIETGRLDVRNRLSYRVTYHDPCYLGRHTGEYEAPRRILRELGCELAEMPRNRENSFCCGAGGGRIWIADQPGQERPSENRIREAVGLPDVRRPAVRRVVP